MNDKLFTSIIQISKRSFQTASHSLKNQYKCVSYKIPPYALKWNYIHNWYQEITSNPYYLHWRAARLYVLIPINVEVPILSLDNSSLPATAVDMTAESNFHILFKLLLSAYYQKHECFISNGDFYLPVRISNKSATVLSLEFQESRHSDNSFFEFVVLNRATTLMRAKKKDIAQANNHSAYYLNVSDRGRPVFRRVVPARIEDDMIEYGLYYRPKSRVIGGRQRKTQVPFVAIKSLQHLKQSRTWHVWEFMNDFARYLNDEHSFYAKQKQVAFSQARHIKPTDIPRTLQIDMRDTTVVILDDRLRPQAYPELEANHSHFSTQLFKLIQTISPINPEDDPTKDWRPQYQIAHNPNEICEGDMVLRLQDNLAEDFIHEVEDVDGGSSKTVRQGLLYAHDDPYQTYKAELAGKVPTQSLNINSFGFRAEDDEAEKPSTDVAYMGYPLPDKDSLELALLTSLYQLHLKSVVHDSATIFDRLPSIKFAQDRAFMFAGGIVFVETTNVRFFQLTEGKDLDFVEQEITRLYNWDLYDEIIPLIQEYAGEEPKPESYNNETMSRLGKHRVIISRDYVMEIVDSSERMLPRIDLIANRLTVRDTPHPINDFMPTYAEAEINAVGETFLNAFGNYLADLPNVPISYATLLKAHRKDLYKVLGIEKSNKLDRYLMTRGFDLRSPKSTKDAFLGYQGIFYFPDTAQYMVGKPLSPKYKMENSFVPRRLIFHQNRDGRGLNEIFTEDVLSLLEVNFVRRKQYTVFPFVFKLVEIWVDILAGNNSEEVSS